MDKLIEAATKALNKAYAPYSGFKVGAALLTLRGDIISGCNIENISFTPTVCAERTAIFSAISQGISKFQKIAIVTTDTNPSPPCGVCLQVLNEFVDPEFPIIMANTNGDILEKEFQTLLPVRFTPNKKIGKKK